MKNIVMEKRVKRGRPAKIQIKSANEFNPKSLNITKGFDLNFSDKIFNSMKIGNEEMDCLFSSSGGIMPATNMMVVGGAGAGKTTLALDWLSKIQRKDKKVLFISGEMDEIGYFKYCKRLSSFSNIPVLFLKHHRENVVETLEYVFNEGYDLILIDSVAEVLEMYRDQKSATRKQAESWLIDIQDKTKLGNNKSKIHTTFINIQQVSKSGEFVGSNRLKHMMDAMFIIEVNKDKTERKIHFDKNRDGDKEFKICFTFYKNEVFYSYEMAS